MVKITHKNGTNKIIKPNKDIITELFEASRDMKEIDEVIISRRVKTLKEEQRSKLKDLCTEYQIEVEPLDRKFINHRIVIRETNIIDAFKKLVVIKTAFNSEGGK